VPGWMATLGTHWQATPTLKLSVQFKSFPEYANNTAHTQKNSSATLADLGFTYKATKAVDIYGSAQNIGNRSYYDSGLATTTMNGSTISGGTVPALGMPLNVNVGVRATF
jgi:outer membrane receptor protein involved in Fe transport